MSTWSQKVELFSNRVIAETFRQWIIGALLLAMTVTITISLVTIVKNYKSLTGIDPIIMLLVLIKVLLFTAYEFIWPTEFFKFLYDIIHLTILTIIFNIFTSRLLKKTNGWLRHYKIYTILFIVIQVALLMFGLIFFNNSFTCHGGRKFPVVPYITKVAVLIVVIFIFIMTVIIIKHLKQNEMVEIDEQRKFIYEELGQKNDTNVKKFQMRVLSYGLLAYCI
jgi:hypothetical protein